MFVLNGQKTFTAQDSKHASGPIKAKHSPDFEPMAPHMDNARKHQKRAENKNPRCQLIVGFECCRLYGGARVP